MTNEIRFSEDFEKLPTVWNGTYATLLGVLASDYETIRNRHTSLMYKDTKIRGENRFYNLQPGDYLILIFYHHNTGILFTSFRKNDEPNKFFFYKNRIKESFKLVKV